jgi:tetratricopeptide (TPR) repeat protein
MTNFQVEEQAKNRKQLVDQAINLAMQNKWDDAAKVNRQILDSYPKDVDAYNRLGRSLTELGRYREAKDAYTRAVELDPLNAIAQKNLSRLSALSVETAPKPAPGKVDPRFFIAETGKTGVASLVRTAGRQVLAKLAVGDQVHLKPEGRALYVANAKEEMLGQVEPKLSQRLIDLMKGGNHYAAAIMSISDSDVKVIIRETYQDPSQSGKVSFPTKGDVSAVRPYIKETLIKYGSEEEDEEDEAAEERDFATEGEDIDEPVDAAEFEDEQSGD